MHLIDTFINPTFIVTILTAICAFATVLTIAMPMLARDRMNHRMRTMAVERDKMRAERIAEMSARDRQGKPAADAEGLHAADRRSAQSAEACSTPRSCAIA